MERHTIAPHVSTVVARTLADAVLDRQAGTFPCQSLQSKGSDKAGKPLIFSPTNVWLEAV